MLSNLSQYTEIKLSCYHCGGDCSDDSIFIDDKLFCCNGCKTVYEILQANNMCDYYSIEETPGISKRNEIRRNFDFLDDPDLQNKLIDFTDGNWTKITFFIPQMHCSSCIWILENLYKFNLAIPESEVDFLKKTVSVKYSVKETTLKDVVILLDSLGYLPSFNFEEKTKSKSDEVLKKLYYKIGVAGFAFGNIMLLSFPEYLSLDDVVTDNIKNIFGTLNMLLALPVFLYSASEYYFSAWKGLKKKIINIDVPITLGIFVLFARSYYELITVTGAGYLDSLAALVFFLLIGKLFQYKTYDVLNFERNYQSYFPIAVTIIKDSAETTKPLDKLEAGDRIIIKNGEIVPADSVLISDSANIDYSFVTGESVPVYKTNGSIIYAGGKQVGKSIKVETVKDVSQSYLTQLWNQDAFRKEYSSNINMLVNIISKYFTIIILGIASTAFIFWAPSDIHVAFNAFTAVLIIACPCALALSTPFTLGNSLRIFGRNKFYVKNADEIERMAKVDSIVFDKTGTLTETNSSDINYIGEELSDERKSLISSAAKDSSHPLSQSLVRALLPADHYPVERFEEVFGKGILAIVNGAEVKLGSDRFFNGASKVNGDLPNSSKVNVEINNERLGYFEIKNKYRPNLKAIAANLKSLYCISVLSGDNAGEENNLRNFFGDKARLLFRQSPFDKLNYVKDLQSKNHKVLMIGDGLNDAGALKQSDVGISISENVNNFSPACDGIMESKSFNKLKDFVNFSRTSRKIIILSFIISFLYNLVGLFFAVQGLLSPVIAAILMPISSISVVVFATLSTNLTAKKQGLL